MALQRIIRPVPRMAFMQQRVPVRAFGISRTMRLKEDKTQSAEEIEKAKQEQLRTGDKKSELSSSSEDVVEAEQKNVKDHDKHMEELQKQGAKQAENEK